MRVISVHVLYGDFMKKDILFLQQEEKLIAPVSGIGGGGIAEYRILEFMEFDIHKKTTYISAVVAIKPTCDTGINRKS